MQVSCGVIYKNYKILLVKKAYGDYKDKWEFPGGKRDNSDKSIKSGLQRELKEELNCDSVIHDLIHFMKIKKQDINLPQDLLLYFYNVYLVTNTITLSKEHTEFKWVTFEEAKTMDLIKWDYKLLKMFEDYFNEDYFTADLLAKLDD